MTQLDNLVARVRAHVGRSKDVTRTALVRALLRKGLDLAETRELKLDSLRDEGTERIGYKVSSSEFERLTNLQKTYQSEFPGTALPALASLQLRISLDLDHLFRRDLTGDFASVTTCFAARDHAVLGAIVLGRIKGRLRRNPRGFEPLTRPARDGAGTTTRGTRGARPSPFRRLWKSGHGTAERAVKLGEIRISSPIPDPRTRESAG